MRRVSYVLLSVALLAVGFCEAARWSHRRTIDSELRQAQSAIIGLERVSALSNGGGGNFVANHVWSVEEIVASARLRLYGL